LTLQARGILHDSKELTITADILYMGLLNRQDEKRKFKPYPKFSQKLTDNDLTAAQFEVDSNAKGNTV